MIDSILEAALNAHLDAYAKPKAIPIAWQGLAFTPPTGKPYLRPALLPARTEQATLGSGGDNRHTGIYQVSVVYPDKTASTVVRRTADEIVNHFRLETRLSRDGYLIRVSSPPWGAPVLIENGFISLPVSIAYTCDRNNGDLP